MCLPAEDNAASALGVAVGVYQGSVRVVWGGKEGGMFEVQLGYCGFGVGMSAFSELLPAGHLLVSASEKLSLQAKNHETPNCGLGFPCHEDARSFRSARYSC